MQNPPCAQQVTGLCLHTTLWVLVLVQRQQHSPQTYNHPAQFSITTLPISHRDTRWGHETLDLQTEALSARSPNSEPGSFACTGSIVGSLFVWKLAFLTLTELSVCVCERTVPGTATICLSSCFKLMMSLQSWMSSILEKDRRRRINCRLSLD